MTVYAVKCEVCGRVGPSLPERRGRSRPPKRHRPPSNQNRNRETNRARRQSSPFAPVNTSLSPTSFVNADLATNFLSLRKDTDEEKNLLERKRLIRRLFSEVRSQILTRKREHLELEVWTSKIPGQRWRRNLASFARPSSKGQTMKAYRVGESLRQMQHHATYRGDT